MKIQFSKKKLYRDNITLRNELELSYARNTELVIMMEQSKKLIDETNEKIKSLQNLPRS